MSETKMELTPTEQIVARSRKEHAFTTPNGKAIVLRNPGPLAQFDLVEMLGETARNEVYVGMCLPLTYIASIDGDAPTMRTKRELRALITLLDHDGVNAVCAEVAKEFGARDIEADKEKLKN